MQLQIKPGAALDSAKEIEEIVAKIEEAMETLNSIMNNNMGPVGSGKEISTNWAEEVISNWKNYYTSDIPEIMAEITVSATNLKLAVETAQAYSNEG